MKKLMHSIAAALLIGACACTPTYELMAQDTQLQQLSLEDLLSGGTNYRYTENLYGLQWWGDTCIEPGIDSLVAINPKKNKRELLTTRADINRALQAKGLGELQHLYAVRLPWAKEERILLSLPGCYAVYDWKADTAALCREYPKEAANMDYATASGNLAYTMGNNLYVNGTAVTAEGEGIVCGQAVHRNEFGITKGTFWNAEGTLLAFYRMDESMVTQYPLVDVTARVGKADYIRYPMAGMTSHKVQVGIYNPQTGKTVYLDTGDPTDRYFTNIAWSPDSKSLYLIEVNRDQNHAKLCRYNASTGKLEATLLEETHPKYVEPQSPVVFLPWDKDKFIYQSQRDGFNHLYLYDTEGKLVRQLTQGEWMVLSVAGFNDMRHEVFITSTEQSPLQSTIYKVNTRNGKRTALNAVGGIHTPQLSASGKYLIDTYSTPTEPRDIALVQTLNGNVTGRLLTAANPYEGCVAPTVEVGTIKAADGITDLYYRLTKPADFDPAKKYPVVVYVYGGPHVQLVNDGFMHGLRPWDYYMANKGYLMFTVDNRGSSNRGLNFENATFRQLGIKECSDQLKGVEFLKSLPYVDPDRIGVHGWSFGGHMTTALMLRYPDVFKVGVAGGPVIDWAYYEVMYGERYMDTPQTNIEGYKECNLNNLAGRLKGHLLVIHGDHDPTCVPQHTLSFMKACIDARTYPDLFIYPCHQHGVTGRDSVHLHEKITRYFEDYL